jgi:hypothetical protein
MERMRDRERGRVRTLASSSRRGLGNRRLGRGLSRPPCSPVWGSNWIHGSLIYNSLHQGLVVLLFGCTKMLCMRVMDTPGLVRNASFG